MTYTHSSLSYAQQRDLLGQALDAYQGEDPDRRYPEDTAHEVVDAWLPVYYHEIRAAWDEAGCPEPEEDTTSGDVHHLMTLGLYSAAWGYLWGFVSEHLTHGEVADSIEDELNTTESERVERILNG